MQNKKPQIKKENNIKKEVIHKENKKPTIKKEDPKKIIPKTPKPSDLRFKAVANKPINAPTIPINEIYSRLKNAIDTRIKWQDEMSLLWKIIKKTRENRTKDMKTITNKIGESTREIDVLLGELCKYKQKHTAMKLAYDFIVSEIIRVNKIIDKRSGYIEDINSGKYQWIKSDGTHTSDNTSELKYLAGLSKRKTFLLKWKKHIEVYL